CRSAPACGQSCQIFRLDVCFPLKGLVAGPGRVTEPQRAWLLPAFGSARKAACFLGGAKQCLRLVDAFLLFRGWVTVGDDAGASLYVHLAALDERGTQHDA